MKERGMKGRTLSRLVGRPILLILMTFGPAMAGCASDEQMKDKNASASTPADATGMTQTERTDAYRNPTDMYRGFRASELINKKVENPAGENLGEIEDLVVNLNTGDVRYAVLQFGGIMGLGDRLFAIPANELKFSPADKDKIILNIDKTRLEHAKYIETDRNRWPKDWNAWDDIATVSGSPVPTPSAGNARAYRGSELIGKSVEDALGKSIGKIKDMVVDLNNQKVHYTVLAFDPSFVSPDKLIAFPVTAFKLDPANDKLVLEVDKQKLMEMPGFAATSWPDINDPAYVSEVQRDLQSYPNMESPAQIFTRLDTNKDNYLSMDEAKVRVSVKNSWTRLDQDHDDRVSQEEFHKYY
jgi:sporulation protein YlmC with PRC-barrel domain